MRLVYENGQIDGVLTDDRFWHGLSSGEVRSDGRVHVTCVDETETIEVSVSAEHFNVQQYTGTWLNQPAEPNLRAIQESLRIDRRTTADNSRECRRRERAMRIEHR